MKTHLSIIGPMGIGKSTLVDKLEKEGFKVVRDPVLEIVEKNQGMSTISLQTLIIDALYKQRIDHKDENVIFDTSPFMSYLYLTAQAASEEIDRLELAMMFPIYQGGLIDYMNQIGSVNNIEYVLTDLNHSNVVNVVNRGREWEQGNPTLMYFDEILSNIESYRNEIGVTVPLSTIVHERAYDWKNEKVVEHTLFMLRKLIGGNDEK